MTKTTKITKPAAKTRRTKTQAAITVSPRHKSAPKRANAPIPALPAPAARRRGNTTPTVAPSKKVLITDLLRRQHGASLVELVAATGWQTHSIRAAMTGLRKAGGEIARSKDDSGTSHFRLVAEA